MFLIFFEIIKHGQQFSVCFWGLVLNVIVWSLVGLHNAAVCEVRLIRVV